jgi:hypothetical protein
MAATISEALDFHPTPALLAAVLDEFDDLGMAGGGAVDAAVRQRALQGYLRAPRDPRNVPPQWRHDYAALDFSGLTWSSGRARVPVLPRAGTAIRDDAAADAPALAIDNAGGLVHLGATYLDPLAPAIDPNALPRRICASSRPRRIASLCWRRRFKIAARTSRSPRAFGSSCRCSCCGWRRPMRVRRCFPTPSFASARTRT